MAEKKKQAQFLEKKKQPSRKVRYFKAGEEVGFPSVMGGGTHGKF